MTQHHKPAPHHKVAHPATPTHHKAHPSQHAHGGYPPVIVVDTEDNVIGHKHWGDLKSSDIHRASFLWITNSKGQVLLSKRSEHIHNPGVWCGAVSGTVQKGETYEQNIYKEAEEEIGLTGISFNLGPKLLVQPPNEGIMIQWFVATLDRDPRSFHLDKAEVAQVKWVDRDEFQADIQAHPEKYSPAVPLWAHLWA